MSLARRIAPVLPLHLACLVVVARKRSHTTEVHFVKRKEKKRKTAGIQRRNTAKEDSPKLPLGNSAVGRSPDGVGPRVALGLLGVLPHKLLVDLDAETSALEHVDHAAADVEDFGVFDVRQKVKVSDVVVHSDGHLAVERGHVQASMITFPRVS